MRWIPFVIFAYILILLQTTVAGLLVISPWAIGPVGPDLMAILAVFVALNVRSGADAMIAGWILGLALDLTAGGVGGGTVVGPMCIAYALGCRGVFHIREVIFRERAVSQALLTLLFCLFAHGLWVTLQSVRLGRVSASMYGVMLLQVVGVGLYTGLLAPLGYFALIRLRSWLIISPRGRSRR